MFGSMRKKTQAFRQHLTQLDNQPLNKAALVVILFLDLFILISIFDGLADHTRQLASPSQQIPSVCREIIVDANWNPTNRLDHLAQIVSSYHESHFVPDEKNERKTPHPLCEPVVHAVKSIRQDDSLSKSLLQHRKLQRETRALRVDLDRIKGTYDTALLETIANQQEKKSNVASLKEEISGKTDRMNQLAEQQALLQSSIEQDRRVRDLYVLVEAVSEADRRALRDDLRQLNFWYPVKRLGMEMIFLLPLLLIFYFWNSRSIAGGRPYQILVSSHLLVVALIPAFFKVIELVYDIIPKKLLKQLIELLESLNLIAIWHYLLIGVAILVALALTYLFQKKLFSQEKLMQRRMARGLCHHCGQRLPPDCRHCPVCGSGQYRVCKHCHEATHVHGKYCMACGHGAD